MKQVLKGIRYALMNWESRPPEAWETIIKTLVREAEQRMTKCGECDTPVLLVGNAYCSVCYNQGKAEQYYLGAQHCRNHLKEALAKPSCVTCKHGSWDEDRSVGIPLHLEDCEFMPSDDILADIHDVGDETAYEMTAAQCGHWELNPDSIGPTY